MVAGKNDRVPDLPGVGGETTYPVGGVINRVMHRNLLSSW